LFVSTSGFSKDARYEADRSVVPLTLLNLADLRDLLIDHYEKVDSATRALVPLRQLYLPVD
jgi:restriction system protein